VVQAEVQRREEQRPADRDPGDGLLRGDRELGAEDEEKPDTEQECVQRT